MPSNPGARVHPMRRPDPALLAGLRARIRKLDGVAPAADGGPGALPLGVPEIDAALPWGGLPRASLHEVVGDGASADGGNAAAAGFSAALLGRFAAATGAPVLWCRRGPGLYGPGLARFGLGPECLVVARTGSAAAVLWAGGHPGLPLAAARALVPGLMVFAADPAGERQTLEDLADWCGRYSPWTAVDGAAGLWLDVSVQAVQQCRQREQILDHFGGTKSPTRAILSELPQSPS